MVNLVAALFQQFANTKCKVSGRQVAENIIPQLQERHFRVKINTAEVVCGMHQTQMEERHKVLLSTV
jgi:hypothetical protein